MTECGAIVDRGVLEVCLQHRGRRLAQILGRTRSERVKYLYS